MLCTSGVSHHVVWVLALPRLAGRARLGRHPRKWCSLARPADQRSLDLCPSATRLKTSTSPRALRTFAREPQATKCLACGTPDEVAALPDVLYAHDADEEDSGWVRQSERHLAEGHGKIRHCAARNDHLRRSPDADHAPDELIGAITGCRYLRARRGGQVHSRGTSDDRSGRGVRAGGQH